MNNYTKKKPAAKVEEKKHLDKVVTGKVSIKKKSEGRKILEMVFPSAGSDLKTTLVGDVIVPMLMVMVLLGLVVGVVMREALGSTTPASRSLRLVSIIFPQALRLGSITTVSHSRLVVMLRLS